METVIANSRPQPAIPALLVLLLTLVFAASFAGSPAWGAWAVAAGIVVSCGLAIAAGFCSVFPPLAWIAVAWLGSDVVQRLSNPLYGRVAVFAGMLAAGMMVAAQIWRVTTGKFVPTIDDDGEE